MQLPALEEGMWTNVQALHLTRPWYRVQALAHCLGECAALSGWLSITSSCPTYSLSASTW